MGLFDRVEGKLERAYNGIFARAFRAEVPVEIASAIRRAMDDRASHAGRGRAIVPMSSPSNSPTPTTTDSPTTPRSPRNSSWRPRSTSPRSTTRPAARSASR